MSQHYDAWQNLATGLGTERDKTTFGMPVSYAYVPLLWLEALYSEDDIARKIVDAVPESMFRNGFTLKGEGSDSVLEVWRSLRVREESPESLVQRCHSWGRLYGGSALLLGADDGLPFDKPLGALRTIRYLLPIAGGATGAIVAAHESASRDIASPLYGLPTLYDVHTESGSTFRVHESRLVFFGGLETTPLRRLSQGGWDDSVLRPVLRTLQQFSGAFDSIAHLMHDAAQAVFSFGGIRDAVAKGEGKTIVERMITIDRDRSSARALFLDREHESFAREGVTFGGLAPVLDIFLSRMASAARMPVTLLFGRSPAGLNATGESDVRLWYDTLAADRETYLRPRLERVLRLCAAQANVPWEGLELKFAALWQETDSERETRLKTRADRDAIYVDRQVLSPEEVALARFATDDSDVAIDPKTREIAPLPTADEPAPIAVADMIRGSTEGWYVYSSDGTKRLGGPYATRDEALARLREIEANK